MTTTPTRFPLAKQAAPFGAMGLIVLAGCAARAAAALSGEEAVTAATVAAVGVVIAVVVAFASGENLRRRRRQAVAIVAAAAGWIATVAMAGISWNAMFLLAAIGSLMSLPHWRKHRIPNAAPAVMAPAAPKLGIVPTLWKANIACPGGPLEGATLARDPAASNQTKDVYRVQLRPGKQTIKSAVAALALIATGLHSAPENMAFERVPGSDDTSQIQLTVVRTSPIAGGVTYPGPMYRWDQAKRTGIVDLGPYFDGDGYAPWALFTKGSIWGGIVIGGIGSGKSRLLEGLACSMLASGHVTLWFADPQRGASSVALADHADWTARGEDECLDMLRALSLVAHWREIEASVNGWTGFTPGKGRTALVGILEECHRVFWHPDKDFRKEAVQLAEGLLRVSRKLGITLICASQEGDLNTWGGSNGLRSALRAGNTVVLRTENEQCKGVLGLDFDPTDLPKIPGYGYTVAGEQLGGRTAPFRSCYLDELEEDEYDAVKAGGTIREGTSYWWLSQTPSAPLDEVARKGAGDAYARRNETAQAGKAALTSQLQALLGGRLPADSHVARPAVEVELETVRFPDWPPVEPAPPALTESQRAVLNAIAGGAASPGEILDKVQLGRRRVQDILVELRAADRIDKTRHGRYIVKAA